MPAFAHLLLDCLDSPQDFLFEAQLNYRPKHDHRFEFFKETGLDGLVQVGLGGSHGGELTVFNFGMSSVSGGLARAISHQKVFLCRFRPLNSSPNPKLAYRNPDAIGGRFAYRSWV
jgi:hypothetical protein